jgi:hypothetical protein
MTTTITNHGNGTATQRKTLASQLDRLDGILDALSDGLNQAVASAVQNTLDQVVREAVAQAVREAVQGLVREILTNPDAIALLRATLAPEPTMPAPPPPPPAPATRRATGLGAWLWGRAKQACAAVCQGASRVASAVKHGLHIAQPYKKPLIIAAGVGTAVALGACLAGPVLAGPAAWLGGFLGSLAVRAGGVLRRGLRLNASPV